MKFKNKKLIIIIITSIIFIISLILSILSKNVKMNPPGTIGNTPGNINNSGLFCEYEGTVYFSNSADNGRLYSMSVDESNKTKLSNLNVQNILAGGKYLYFFQSGTVGETGIGNVISGKSFVRSDFKLKKITTLNREAVIRCQLIDNYLYYTTVNKSGINFEKLKIDKSDKKTLSGYEINPACTKDGIIYYYGTKNDHYLHTLDTRNDSTQVLLSKGVWFPIIDGDYIYYMDIENNYRLCRYSPYANTIEVLTEDRVDCYNLNNGFIYYQKNDATDPALICMQLDGSNKAVIAKGNYTNINMTSQYVYFTPFGVDGILYHSRLGSSSYEPF